jgi:hypothetical protein
VAHTALAVAAARVALAFSMATFERWLARPDRRHELAWAIAFLLFSLASASLAAGAALGWNGVWFRFFYLFGAIANVPFLAVGTIYLLGGRTAGDRSLAFVGAWVAFSAGVLAVAPLTHAIPRDALPQGSDVFGPLPRVLAATSSGVAALVVLGGALWSAWRFRRGHMLWANLLIALGTLVTGASGLLNSVLDEMDGFAVTLVAGITIIFAGFLVATAGSAKRATEHLPPDPAGDVVDELDARRALVGRQPGRAVRP